MSRREGELDTNEAPGVDGITADPHLGIELVCLRAGFGRQALHHHRTGRTTRPFPPPCRYEDGHPEWKLSVVDEWIANRPIPGRPRSEATT